MENEKFLERLSQLLKNNYRQAHSEAIRKGIYLAKLKRQQEKVKNS